MAERAGVSTALVHYHFHTKARLLEAAARRLADSRLESRRAALSRHAALELLDDLWTSLADGVAEGTERALLELSLLAADDRRIAAVLSNQRDAEQSLFSTRLPRLLAELGTTSLTGPEEAAQLLAAALDGFAASLLKGGAESRVRAAYDAFWLTLIAAGQSVRS